VLAADASHPPSATLGLDGGTARGVGALTSLGFRERPAEGEPDGLLVLHHGRGADEFDLLPLGDAIDPQRRLHVVTPAAPLQLPDTPGRHWYLVPQVGHPDPDSFLAACDALGAFHDELWERTGLGPESTVLGGFSMGSVMSYALGLAGARAAPAGILAFSGFVPELDEWPLEVAARAGLRTFIAHGRRDPVIGVEFARRARELLSAGGLEVSYHESDLGHQIDAMAVVAAARWLAATLVSR
jgi:phospholipase/carboxylesterase